MPKHRHTSADRCISYALWSLALLTAVIPLIMLWDLLITGFSHLSLEFILDNPSNSGRTGGIASLLASTGLILLVCLSAVIPLGLACSLYINELVDPNSHLQRLLDHALDILSGVPSIIYGLFGYVFFAQVLQLGFSILSGGLSLACMVLPLFVRIAQSALRTSPIQYRQAAHALNISHHGFIWRILLPSSAQGLAAATIIATGRALAETAVLIFTAGYVTRMPTSLLDSGRSLSVHIYDLAMNVPGGSAPAAATALVLIGLLIILNLSARQLSQRWLKIAD